jgi:hypothetical protein
LHHLPSLHGPVQRAPAAQPDFAAAFFLAANAGCDTASALIAMIRDAIAIARLMINSLSDADGQVRIDQQIEGSNGGRDRDRTCDPFHVKEVLSR